MRPHQPGERLLRGGVERRGRLVEEPQGAARDEEAGERHAPALAGREIGDGKARRVREPDRLERLAGRRRLLAEKVAGEGEVLGRGQRPLEGVAMADEMERLRERPLADAVGPDRTRVRPQLAGEDARAGSTCRRRCGR